MKYKEKLLKTYKELNDFEDDLHNRKIVETQEEFEKAAYQKICFFTYLMRNSYSIRDYRNKISPKLFQVLAYKIYCHLYDKRFFELFELIFGFDYCRSAGMDSGTDFSFRVIIGKSPCWISDPFGDNIETLILVCDFYDSELTCQFHIAYDEYHHSILEGLSDKNINLNDLLIVIQQTKNLAWTDDYWALKWNDKSETEYKNTLNDIDNHLYERFEKHLNLE